MENILKCIWESDPPPDLLDSTIKVTQDLSYLNILLDGKLTYLNGSSPDNKISFDISHIYTKDCDNFELWKRTLSKALLVSKDANTLILQIVNYIVVNSKNSGYKMKVTHLLDVLITFCDKEKKTDLLFDHIKYEFIINFLLNVIKNDELKKYGYDIIKYCFSVIPTKEGVKYLNNLFDFYQRESNFDLFCFILNEVSTEIARDELCCFHSDIFWIFLESCFEQPISILHKQVEYILRIYITKFYFLNPNKYFHPNCSEDSWNTFFTLMDIGKEKQLHLVEPALDLFKCLENFHFIWQKCIYNIYLNHSQDTIVYKVVEYIIQQDYKNEELKIILKMMLPAINKNDYNKATCVMFSSFQCFCRNMNQNDFDILLHEILQLTWNPVSMYKVFQSVFAPDNKKPICIDYFHDVVNCIFKLPHAYIKGECLKHLISYFWDGKSFYKIYKMAITLQRFNLDYKKYFSPYDISEEVVDFLINELLILNDNRDNVSNIEICFHLIDKLKYDLGPTIIGKYIHKLNSDVKLFAWQQYLQSKNRDQQMYLQIEGFIIEFFQEHLNSDTRDYFLNLLVLFVELNDYSSVKILNILIESCVTPDCLKEEQTFICLAFLNKFPTLLDHIFFKNTGEKLTVREQVIEIWKFKMFREKDQFICQEYIRFLFKFYEKGMSENITLDVIDLFQTFFDCHRNEVLACVYEKLIIFMQLTEKPELVLDFMNVCYSKLDTLKKDFYFKKILVSFINALYSVEYVTNSNDNIVLTNNILFEFSTAYPVIRLHIILAIKNLLNMDKELNWSQWTFAVLQIYLQGIITTKDERTEYYICQECLQPNTHFNIDDLKQLSEQSNPNIINTVSRLMALEAILDIAKHDISTVITCLRGEYLKVFKKRYFPNSEIHIKKLRITHALLHLIPYVKQFSKEAIQMGVFLLDCILEESNQPCVKQIFNLVLIILLRDAAFAGIQYIKRVMSMSSQVSSSVQIGLLPTFYHLALFDAEEPMRSFSAVLALILPWTMGSQFRLRIYSQDIIKRLIREARENNYEEFLQKYEHLESCIDSSIEGTGQAYENTLKTDLVFLNYCNPISDNSLKTILYDIPRLNAVCRTEWENTHFCILSLHNSGHLKTLCHKTLLESKDQSLSIAINNYLEKTVKNKKDPNDTETVSLNIQKKITPWKNISGENDTNNRNTDFILVASLIEKYQNLGGLSRTCEAFGIQNLVFNDAKVVENKEFQSLSMSSEGWINVTEVKVKDLKHRILEFQKDGYCVVGAEQTTNSIKLNEFQFPKKTILLLGNEKTGITPDIIPLLDKCIEIPQFGQTRSLNVHVAGATIIWEYIKQHSLQNMDVSI